MIKRIFWPNPFTGWHMLGVICLFFGVTIAVNLTLAVLATQSWTGLVVPNSYVASQEFNEKLHEAEKQAALGWNAQFHHVAGRAELTLLDHEGEPIAGADVTAKIGRTVHENDDFTVALPYVGNGLYAGKAELAHGVWEADIVIGHGGDTYEKRYRFFVRETKG